ncbi:NtaA/DmoA family FMN-dependent monooxygenase [Vibrio olivae]|uniref:NtaA/DmoA family FMN-dependent monooxygenase n=1 Tax=Vibrio olivae TaxID=1243002 RepID=A0ABV5HT29_9VIBR
MSRPAPLCIGLALAMSCLTKSGWRREDSQVEHLFSIDDYIQLAKQAEAAKLDFVFRPDTLFLPMEMVGTEPGFSSLDPMVLLAALATATSKIGLVSTASTTFNPPYVVARQLQSLNWLSQGRIGWNIVTAIDGQTNFGQQNLMASKQRYEMAAEFTEVVQKLWNSYPDDALTFDRQSGEFANSNKVQAINHHGDFFNVQGPLNVPQYPSGNIPLFQAGASPWGRDFAAKVANAIFAATPDLHAGIELRNDLRQRAALQGRNADDIKVLPGLSLYLAETRQQAEDLYYQTHTSLTREKKLAYLQKNLGVDFSALDDTQPITVDMLPKLDAVRSHTHTNLLTRFIERESPTLEHLLTRPEVMGSAHWLVIGTPEDAVESIKQRVEAGAADGFIAVPGGSRQSAQLFFDQVIPLLAKAGLSRTEYQGSTLRDHLGLNA